MDLYGVMGNPIHHSKSPAIHHFFANQTQQAMRYTAIEVEPDRLGLALDSFQAQGGKGLNITSPFKLQAMAFVQELTPRAERAQAINMITFTANGLRIGDNSDGIGLIRDLTRQQLDLTNKNILIWGAGGAVRGILSSILEAKPRQLIIANRTASKALQLQEIYTGQANMQICSIAEVPNLTFDFIINATSGSLTQAQVNFPKVLINQMTYCYDLSYGQASLGFAAWAKQLGCKHFSDGMGMLIEQAAESFYLWRGIMPDTSKLHEKYSRLSI
jgi:shikimate dehydrogenase